MCAKDCHKSISKKSASKGIVTAENSSILRGICKPLGDILRDWKAGKFITTAYITEIDESYKWLKNVCKNCSSWVGMKEDGKWYCSKEYCIAYENGNYHRETRFKVRYFIEDAKKNHAQILMGDELIKRRVNKTPLQCKESQKKIGDKHGVPNELTYPFLGREFVLKLEVHRRYNLEQNSTCYKGVDFTDNKDVIDEWNYQNNTLQEINDSIDNAPAQVIIDEKKAEEIQQRKRNERDARISATTRKPKQAKMKFKIHI
ncbi:uncharacterized protein LOC141626794 isoform X2 [Silene latifolia]|uniref:uncharacterized protein LOC141626794 isoform X2 n=1 Tax=Silene latifolia TaxID=37657 RepID=UPI003D777BC8